MVCFFSALSSRGAQASRGPLVLHLPWIDSWALDVEVEAVRGRSAREMSVSVSAPAAQRGAAEAGGDDADAGAGQAAGDLGGYMQRVLVRA